jgi:hypothetical protein
MWLPTQAQVNAATRHAASFAGGAILMFGLSTKIDPETVKNIINSLGTAVNDIVVIIGLVSPLIAGYFASKSASPVAQAQAVAATASTPGPQQKAAQVVILNAASEVPGTEKVVNPTFAPDPATSPKVTTQ